MLELAVCYCACVLLGVVKVGSPGPPLVRPVCRSKGAICISDHHKNKCVVFERKQIDNNMNQGVGGLAKEYMQEKGSMRSAVHSGRHNFVHTSPLTTWCEQDRRQQG